MKDRAAVILIHKGRLLCMWRHKNGEEYFCLPGGGIESGERPAQTAVRELQEETTIELAGALPIFTLENQGRTEHYFLPFGTTKKIRAILSGPELAKQSKKNRYTLTWVKLRKLERIPFYPEEARTRLLALLNDPGCCGVLANQK